jgi:nicotinamide-nucleotide amidase
MWDKWINKSVADLKNYIQECHLKSVVLGLSGGIDSTVSAVICHLATKDMPSVTFIGRSLPIKNAGDDTSIASRLGKVLCDDFAEVNMYPYYHFFRTEFYKEEEESKATPISDGNIMARLRMMYLYQLAHHYNGMVIDTDNATEHALGFYTIHGDVGDYNVGIRYLYKHEIWELAEVLASYIPEAKEAINESIALAPTDGNTGGTDMDQIAPGATYGDVDMIIDSLFDRDKLFNAIDVAGYDLVRQIERRYRSNYYKDKLPITITKRIE